MSSIISIIIPTLQEERCIGDTLGSLPSGGDLEVIVADGGSSDATLQIARRLGARTIRTAGGRARQMNAAAAAARGEILLFLHADTRLPVDFASMVRRILTEDGTVAGAFRLRIDASGWGFRVIESVANVRSRLLQTPYGDQALFMSREVFQAAGMFPEMPIMEDFVFVSRLRRKGRIALASGDALTSARRWRRLGLLRTTLVNWGMVCGYKLGIAPEHLEAWYRSR